SAPEPLMAVAEPIAETMTILHRVEKSQGANLSEAPRALQNVRNALEMLQHIDEDHEAVDDAMEAVATSLSKLFALSKATPSQPGHRPAAPAAAPVAAVPAAAVGQAPAPTHAPAPAYTPDPAQAPAPAYAPDPARAPSPAYAPNPARAPAPAYAPDPARAPAYAPDPVPAPAFTPAPAVAPAPAPAYAPAPAAAPAPHHHSPTTEAVRPPQDHVSAQINEVVARRQATVDRSAATKPEVPDLVPTVPLPGDGPVQPQPGVAAFAASYARAPVPATAGAPPAHVPAAAGPTPAAAPFVPAGNALDVELAAHSGSNFYKGLGGNDIVKHGGLFVQTYTLPRVGASVALRVLLPGDLEFFAEGTVKWIRETRSGESEPGFGAQITRVDDRGRQLIYRYVRNREPIFYDDDF
ncbi:MAG: PilZ domain-containing protein, partial [Myxococcota bacterium]